MIIWMLEAKVLCVLNTSARLNYNSTANSNRQAFLVSELAEKEGLGARLNEDEVWLKADAFLVSVMALADTETWDLFTGAKRLNNTNTVVLSKMNKKMPEVNCLLYVMTWIAENSPDSRPVGCMQHYLSLSANE